MPEEKLPTDAPSQQVAIQSAAGYSANIESDRKFGTQVNGKEHRLHVTDPDGNSLFAFGQNGEIATPDGWTFGADGQARDDKGNPPGQLDPSINIYRTPGGYELSFDKEQGVRTVQTPAGQRFRVEDMPRQLYPSGLYYD